MLIVFFCCLKIALLTSGMPSSALVTGGMQSLPQKFTVIASAKLLASLASALTFGDDPLPKGHGARRFADPHALWARGIVLQPFFTSKAITLALHEVHGHQLRFVFARIQIFCTCKSQICIPCPFGARAKVRSQASVQISDLQCFDL